MAKTDDRASHYVFVEDEDIFAEDEKRLAIRRKEASGTISSNVTVTKSLKVNSSKKSSLTTSRFQQDPAVVQRDLNKLRRAVKLLSTIPPPPSVTNPQFSLHDINLWNHQNIASETINKWRPGLKEEDLGHDVYLNTNNYVEELEHLRQRLNQRFVSNETASHLTFTAPALTEHEKEIQRRNGMLKSSTSHASSLSQRKNFYNQFSNPVFRTFLYDNKKAGFTKSHSESKISSKNANAYRALFNSPKKQGCSTTQLVASNSQSSASSSYCSTMPPSNYSIPSAASSTSSSSSSSLVNTSRNSLSGFVSSRSEKLVSSVSRVGDSGSKRMYDKSKYEEQPGKSVKKPKKLSQLHGKKMLWAVETLLKSEGVVNTDPEYKALYSNIYRETTQVWLKHCEKSENGRFKDSVTGTSDLMVKVAKKLLPGVEQKLGIVCSIIKARKESAKKLQPSPAAVIKNNSVQPPISLSSQPLCVGGSDKRNESTASVVDDVVFSPEMLGVSNLCEGIDAVISSLDDLPPDPGDKPVAPDTKPLNSLSIIDHAITKPDAVLSIDTNSKVVETSSLTSLPSEAVNPCPPELFSNSKSASDITPVLDTSVSCITVCPIEEKLPSQSNVTEVKSSPTSTLINDTDHKGEGSLSDKDNNMIDWSENDSSKKELSKEVKKKDSNEGENNFQASVAEMIPDNITKVKRIPVCIVKLEKCDYIISEKSVTHDKSNLSNEPCSAASTPSNNLERSSNSSRAKKNTFEDHLEDESPGQSSVSSGRRRSKRKRTCDVSSTENTPTSSGSKSQNSKRICSNSTSDLNEFDTPTSYLRRSSRNKLSVDGEPSLGPSNTSKTDNDSSPIIAVETNDFNEDDGGASSLTSCNQHFEDSVLRSDESNSVTVSTHGESSTSNIRPVTPNNIDKENDSSMENISDVDNQNWSPILKLTRSSKDLWSSELKKKKIRRKKENSENSPASFLDLEGPFKYRLCKRAHPGEFVSAVIKGEMYLKSFNKLIKKKVITKDCVLVRTVEEGIELKIPLQLLKRERMFFGPDGFQNMICDIVEDAICKLEGFDSNMAFNGFTIHDINQAALTSCMMERILNVIEQTGEVVKPLFAMYKYAIVKKSPENFKDFYKIFVEVLKTSLFLRKTVVEDDTIQVRPLKAESPKKIQLEINIPIHLMGKNSRFKENILKDLTPVHNIISC